MKVLTYSRSHAGRTSILLLQFFLLTSHAFGQLLAPGDQTHRLEYPPSISGRLEGSLQQMRGEGFNLNSGAQVTGEWFVPGTPNVNINGAPDFGGILDGNGSNSPSGYWITINGGSQLGAMVRFTDPVSLPIVNDPPSPAGSQDLNINSASDIPADWSVVRDVNINSAAPLVEVAPGTYGRFNVSNGGQGIRLGLPGTTEPVVYHFQELTLNSNTQLELAGPVELHVKDRITVNSGCIMGNPAQPDWLRIKVAHYGFTDNSSSQGFAHMLHSPSGHVYVNGQVTATVFSQRLTINSGGVLRAGGEGTAPANQAPTADAQSVTVDEDSTVVITLTSSDPDNDPVTYEIVDGPTKGTMSGEAPTLVYTPAPNYHGADSFTFRVNDGTANSEVATVSITVNPVNDAPEAIAQSVTVDEDSSVEIALSGSDLENDPVTYEIVDGPTEGTLSGEAPALVYTPAPNYHGGDSFTFRVNDGTANSEVATVSITVNPINDAPEAMAQSVTVEEDSSVEIALSGSDPDGDPVTYEIVDGPTEGTLSGEAPTLVYTPAPNYHGGDSFTFRVNDGTANSEVATVSITVNPVNDVPEAIAQSVTVDEDSSVEIMLSGSDIETSADELIFSIGNLPTNGSLSGQAPYMVYTPHANFNGADSFTFQVNDGEDDSLPATVTINVVPVNDAPTANSQDVTVNEDESVTITLAGSDLENDPLTFGDFLQPAHGTYTADGNQVIYTPHPNYFGPDQLQFRANDGEVSSLLATIHITVVPVNDPPQVALVLPLDGSVHDLRNTVGLQASASDSDGTIAQVKFFIDGQEVAVSNSAPYTAGWTPLAVGDYQVQAQAVDNEGAVIDSQIHTIEVVSNNHPPTVNAGIDQELRDYLIASLEGAAADDGLPEGSTLQTQWQKVSGPGEVSFDNAESLTTLVSFSQPGTYVLRLTATDGEYSAQDDVTISALAENKPPVVDAGPDQVIAVFETRLAGVVTDDGLSIPADLHAQWEFVEGAGNAVFADPTSPSSSVRFTQAGLYKLRLTADDGIYTASDEVLISINRENEPPEIVSNPPTTQVTLYVQEVDEDTSEFGPSLS